MDKLPEVKMDQKMRIEYQDNYAIVQISEMTEGDIIGKCKKIINESAVYRKWYERVQNPFNIIYIKEEDDTIGIYSTLTREEMQFEIENMKQLAIIQINWTIYDPTILVDEVTIDKVSRIVESIISFSNQEGMIIEENKNDGLLIIKKRLYTKGAHKTQ